MNAAEAARAARAHLEGQVDWVAFEVVERGFLVRVGRGASMAEGVDADPVQAADAALAGLDPASETHEAIRSKLAAETVAEDAPSKPAPKPRSHRLPQAVVAALGDAELEQLVWNAGEGKYLAQVSLDGRSAAGADAEPEVAVAKAREALG